MPLPRDLAPSQVPALAAMAATGLTFYDDDVTAFFSHHTEGQSVMFLVALGRSAKRRSG